MKPNEVILIDAGTGNLRSVEKALAGLGAKVYLTQDPDVVYQQHSRTVLPGVGAFADFMTGLRQRSLVGAIRAVVSRGDPLLGICVGMQALFEYGEEMGIHSGLGFLPGRVVRFGEQAGLKIPHTGWNQVRFEPGSSLFSDIPAGAYVYFNHSYFCAPAKSQHCLASTEYGGIFTSAVQAGNIYGVQFHPEKSQQIGLKLLANFLHI